MKSIFITLAFVLLLISNIVSCRPSSTKKPKTIKPINFDVDFDKEGLDKRYKPCLNDDELNELCERCMRIAEVHGDDIYAMCCIDEDGAQEFCKNYVFYGIT